MEIQKVTDTAFAKYGKVMSDIPVERILKEMEHTPLPEDVIMFRLWKRWKYFRMRWQSEKKDLEGCRFRLGIVMGAM